MLDAASQAKVMAQAVYEIRLLLGGYLGSCNPGDMAVRRAAHLAYALHNEALAMLEGGSFDARRAGAMVGAVDAMLGSDFGPCFHGLLRLGLGAASDAPSGQDAEQHAAADRPRGSGSTDFQAPPA